jgi:hypothetical protein
MREGTIRRLLHLCRVNRGLCNAKVASVGQARDSGTLRLADV